MCKFLEQLIKLEATGEVQILRVKNRFDDITDSGYKDVNINLLLSNQHTCEVQLHLSQIHGIGKKGHRTCEWICVLFCVCACVCLRLCVCRVCLCVYP